MSKVRSSWWRCSRSRRSVTSTSLLSKQGSLLLGTGSPSRQSSTATNQGNATSNGWLPPPRPASARAPSMRNTLPDAPRRIIVGSAIVETTLGGSLRRICREASRPSIVTGNLSSLSCTTWNARALFCTDPYLAQKKQHFFRHLVLSSDVVGIQEAHGNETNARKARIVHEKTHQITHHPNPKARGTIISIKNNMLGVGTVLLHDKIIEGRAHARRPCKCMQSFY